MDILTRLLLTYPAPMAVVALAVAVAELCSFAWQVSRVIRVRGGKRG